MDKDYIDHILENALAKGHLVQERELFLHLTLEECKLIFLRLFGPNGFNVPNPEGAVGGFVLLARAKPRKWDTKTTEYIQDVVGKHLVALGEREATVRRVSLSELPKMQGKVDPSWLTAMAKAQGVVRSQLHLLQPAQKPETFVELMNSFSMQSQDPITNSAFILTADLEAELNSHLVQPGTVNDFQTLAIEGVRSAALGSSLQWNPNYPQGPFWPLLAVMASRVWPFGVIKKFFGREFIVLDPLL